MARDLFISLPVLPEKSLLESVIQSFFGEAGEVEWSEDRWIVSLPGEPSWPYAALLPEVGKDYGPERWLEVFYGNPINVITRLADPYTNALAKGLAECITLYWESTLEGSV